jgi:hypothetical protein
MPSRLAVSLLRVPRASGPVGDTLWRHANIIEVDSAGVAPTDQLLGEFLSFLSGENAVRFASLIPDTAQIAAMVATGNADIRTGCAQNPMIDDSTLAILASDRAPAVADAAKTAAAARADARAAATGSEPTALGLVDPLDLEGFRTVVETNPVLAVAAIVSSAKSAEVLEQIRRADKPLHDMIMSEWITGKAPLTTPVAKWVIASELRRDTFLDGVNPQALRRRCSGGALEVFMGAGVIPTPRGPEGFASIESMMLVLPAHELAGMLVGSTAPVSDGVLEKVLLKAAPTLVGNFLAGSSTRKPARGEILRMLEAADIDTRKAWSDAVGRVIEDFEVASGAPWAGELLLMGKLDWLADLPLMAVKALDEVLTERFGDDQAVWEFAVILAEEWETTLFDLLDSAVAMEGQPA